MDSRPISPYDLVLKNAHVIDPSQDWDSIADIAIRSGRIATFGPNIEPGACADVRDASGTYISPGWIDLHGHWFEGGLYGINAEIGLNHGVTTAVDAGTTGFANFRTFHDTAIVSSRARILAFVHISFLGLQAVFAEELTDLRYARPDETAIVIDQYTGIAVGVKVRIGSMTGANGDKALELALEAARQSNTRLMVHISAGADTSYILEHLRPGDILTHCFHGNQNDMLLPGHAGLVTQAWDARRRGVYFDVGHGCGSFSWTSARRAFEHHFLPDTISTDLHRYSVAPPWTISMPEVLSKFLSLGMSIQDVIARVTVAPARVLGRETDLASLRPGREADLVQFAVEHGEFTFTDAHQRENRGDRRIKPLLCLRNGITYRPGDIEPAFRPFYPCDQPVFEAVKP